MTTTVTTHRARRPSSECARGQERSCPSSKSDAAQLSPKRCSERLRETSESHGRRPPVFPSQQVWSESTIRGVRIGGAHAELQLGAPLPSRGAAPGSRDAPRAALASELRHARKGHTSKEVSVSAFAKHFPPVRPPCRFPLKKFCLGPCRWPISRCRLECAGQQTTRQMKVPRGRAQ